MVLSFTTLTIRINIYKSSHLNLTALSKWVCMGEGLVHCVGSAVTLASWEKVWLPDLRAACFSASAGLAAPF